ncbi:hypothetical protein M752DRAFT_319859 [Aspergillus phoenicis ATCC 13157]|uniref:Uncharacterized protein n=1 Tax=Aspergillus phoenicis ATCC 13157 TaxID=1353007 RepID=A0A370PFZ0_ASPPH|nr:hypothetical protein M752DRAFT_319859 [Aspergillus phoenicis ATCC 13157]
MPLPVSHAKVDHVDALTGRLAAVELEEEEEEEARNPRCFNPFAPYLELSSLRQTRQLLVKHGISEASFQNWKELLCGWLDFPVILLLNPSPFDVLGYEQMVQQSPTLGWLEKNLEVLKLKLHDVIVMDTFPMVTDILLESKRFAEDLSELVTDSFELTWTCLRYIQPQIVISCQCSSKARNEKWGSSGGLRAEELSSSEAGARQELVKMMNVDGHHMFVVQHNQMMEGVLKKLFTKVLEPFGRWKERRLAERKKTARAEVILVKESIRDGMKSLIKQMQLFNQIRRQEG